MNGGYIELVIGIINQQTSLGGNHLMETRQISAFKTSGGVRRQKRSTVQMAWRAMGPDKGLKKAAHHETNRKMVI